MSQKKGQHPVDGAAAASGGDAPGVIRLPERPEALGPAQRGGKSSLVGGLLALLAAAAIVLLLFNRGGMVAPVRQPQQAIGQSLHALQLAPLTGVDQPLELADLSDKKAVLINFWGPWCYWCMVEMPDLIQLRETLADEEGFEFLFVSSSSSGGRNEDVDSLRAESEAALSRFESAPPSYYDPGAVSRIAVVQAAGSQSFGYPTTILIDGQGVIHGYWAGYSPEAAGEMQNAVAELLAKE